MRRSENLTKHSVLLPRAFFRQILGTSGDSGLESVRSRSISSFFFSHKESSKILHWSNRQFSTKLRLENGEISQNRILFLPSPQGRKEANGDWNVVLFRRQIVTRKLRDWNHRVVYGISIIPLRKPTDDLSKQEPKEDKSCSQMVLLRRMGKHAIQLKGGGILAMIHERRGLMVPLWTRQAKQYENWWKDFTIQGCSC